jgi:hypothetical protein
MLLYAAAAWLGHYWASVWWAAFDAAFVAVILAAQGAPWSRRLCFAGLIVGCSAGLSVVVAHTGLGEAARVMATLGGHFATNSQLAEYAALQVLAHGIPVACLAVFVGRRPSILWTRPGDGYANTMGGDSHSASRAQWGAHGDT